MAINRLDKAVKVKRVLNAEYSDHDERDTQAVDLLVDLQHFCVVCEISFEQVLRFAREQYRKET